MTIYNYHRDIDQLWKVIILLFLSAEMGFQLAMPVSNVYDIIISNRVALSQLRFRNRCQIKNIIISKFSAIKIMSTEKSIEYVF